MGSIQSNLTKFIISDILSRTQPYIMDTATYASRFKIISLTIFSFFNFLYNFYHRAGALDFGCAHPQSFVQWMYHPKYASLG